MDFDRRYAKNPPGVYRQKVCHWSQRSFRNAGTRVYAVDVGRQRSLACATGGRVFRRVKAFPCLSGSSFTAQPFKSAPNFLTFSGEKVDGMSGVQIGPGATPSTRSYLPASFRIMLSVRLCRFFRKSFHGSFLRSASRSPMLRTSNHGGSSPSSSQRRGADTGAPSLARVE